MHTKDKLAAALRSAGLHGLAEEAMEGKYDDWLSDSATPMLDLMAKLYDVGTDEAFAIRERVKNGEFDSTDEEAEAWAESEEGQATFRKLGAP